MIKQLDAKDKIIATKDEALAKDIEVMQKVIHMVENMSERTDKMPNAFQTIMSNELSKLKNEILTHLITKRNGH